MAEKAITLYRCLRNERSVAGDFGRLVEHDEGDDLIARNPLVKIVPGVTGIEVVHMVHKDTWWDSDMENFPLAYLNQGLGRIIVSVRLDLLRAQNLPFEEDPVFYQPDYLRESSRNKTFYTAAHTALVRVRIEIVVPPNEV